RQLTILVTSASKKEVTCADVFTLLVMWSAIIFLMRSISTISSPIAFTTGGVLAAALDCGDDGLASAVLDIDTGRDVPSETDSFLTAMYCKMSCLVTRPSKPEPFMLSNSEREIPSSCAMLFTKGEKK